MRSSCAKHSAVISSFVILSLFLLTLHHVPIAKKKGASPPSFAPANSRIEAPHRFKSYPEEDVRGVPSADFTSATQFGDLAHLPYNPYPDYNSPAWKRRWRGSHRPCLGPRGVNVNDNAEDMIVAHAVGPPVSLPEPMFGSYVESGMDFNYCFERNGRLGPYDFEGRNGGNTTVSKELSPVDLPDVDWGSLQSQCVLRNQDRYHKVSSLDNEKGLLFGYPTTEDFAKTMSGSPKPQPPSNVPTKDYKKRSAVILRAWDTLDYKPNIIQNIRSMVYELSLHSGGEFSVYLVVQLKKLGQIDILDSKTRQDALDEYVPREFHNMTILFNERTLQKWYPRMKEPGNMVHHMDQPVQLFSMLHPEFDFFWHLELDVRFTGHWYEIFANADRWGKAQPRKLQWERSSKFYMPSVHKSYANFSDVIEAENPDGGIWGPVPYEGWKPSGPKPPVDTPSADDFTWGVGEDPDVLAPQPIIDGNKPHIVTHGFQKIPGEDFPRRVLHTTPVVRLSREILHNMHATQMQEDLDMDPELCPSTFAVLLGLKVAVWPLPLYNNGLDDQIPANVERFFNKPSGADSPYREPRPQSVDVLWSQMTYSWNLYTEQFGETLYKIWLGEGREDQARTCLPGILIHPYKA